MKLVAVIPFLAFLSRLACVSVSSSAVGNPVKSNEEVVAGAPEVSARKPFALPKPAGADSNCEAFSLGGRALSRPCCVVTGPDCVDCFFRGPNSSVLQKTIVISEPGPGGEWIDLDGVFSGDVECVSREPGSIDIFVLGKYNNLYHKSFSSNGWGDWTTLGGVLVEVPTCISLNPNVIDCVLRDQLNYPCRISFDKGKWGGYVRLSATAAMDPLGCGVLPPSRIDCFSSYDAQKMYRTFLSGTWSTNSYSWDTPFYGRNSVVWSNPKKLHIFGLGIRNDLIQWTWITEQWGTPISLGGTFAWDPYCLGIGDNQLHCFGIGTDSRLYHEEWDGKKWSGWEICSSGGKLYIGPLSCIVISSSRIDCFARDINRTVVQVLFRI